MPRKTDENTYLHGSRPLDGDDRVCRDVQGRTQTAGGFRRHRQRTSDADNGIPEDYWAKAQCVVVIPVGRRLAARQGSHRTSLWSGGVGDPSDPGHETDWRSHGVPPSAGRKRSFNDRTTVSSSRNDRRARGVGRSRTAQPSHAPQFTSRFSALACRAELSAHVALSKEKSASVSAPPEDLAGPPAAARPRFPTPALHRAYDLARPEMAPRLLTSG